MGWRRGFVLLVMGLLFGRGDGFEEGRLGGGGVFFFFFGARI